MIAGKANAKVVYNLKKYAGDPPKKGEFKHPVATIDFGDGISTVYRDYSSDGTLLCEQVASPIYPVNAGE